jgi:hypothetical protein
MVRLRAMAAWIFSPSKTPLRVLGGEVVDLNMPHEFGGFIRHLCLEVLQLLLIVQFLQHLLEHLGDLANITSIILELANIPVRKTNP